MGAIGAYAADRQSISKLKCSDVAGTKKGSFANDVQKFQSKPNRMGGTTYVEELIGPEPKEFDD